MHSQNGEITLAVLSIIALLTMAGMGATAMESSQKTIDSTENTTQ